MLYEVITGAILCGAGMVLLSHGGSHFHDTIGKVMLLGAVLPRNLQPVSVRWLPATARMAPVITSYSIHYTKLYDRSRRTSSVTSSMKLSASLMHCPAPVLAASC